MVVRGRTRLTRKGQVTVPAKIREAMELHEGDRLDSIETSTVCPESSGWNPRLVAGGFGGEPLRGAGGGAKRDHLARLFYALPSATADVLAKCSTTPSPRMAPVSAATGRRKLVLSSRWHNAARLQQRMHGQPHRRIHQRGDDAAVDNPNRVVEVFTRLQGHLDDALVRSRDLHVEQARDWRTVERARD